MIQHRAWLAAALAGCMGMVALAADAPPARIVATHIHMQASSAIFKKWPSGGTTWHYGEGYIEPLGQATYYCGENFPEAREHPLPEWGKGLMKSLTGRDDPLFCVYTTAEGTFFVYDAVAGTRARFDDGGQNQMVNLVIDGTGPYQGATGVWLGLTEGRGTMTEVIPGRRLPAVLMKIMDGYVKLPAMADPTVTPRPSQPAATPGAPVVR
ncbi:MAG: hypothetical protein QM718_03545 [Steroidobacteraceae bacterium]